MRELPAPPSQDRHASKEIAVITAGLILGALLLIEVLFLHWSPLDLF